MTPGLWTIPIIIFGALIWLQVLRIALETLPLLWN